MFATHAHLAALAAGAGERQPVPTHEVVAIMGVVLVSIALAGLFALWLVVRFFKWMFRRQDAKYDRKFGPGTSGRPVPKTYLIPDGTKATSSYLRR